MRIKFLTLITVIAATIGTGSAQNSNMIAEELVAIVGNQSIALSDLYETTQRVIENRKQYGVTSKLEPACEALELILTQKLLAAQARLDSLDKNMNSLDEDVQKRVDEMVKSAGSIKNLEQMTGKAIFQLRDDYKRDITEMTLSGMMETEVRNKVKITHKEVEEYYSSFNTDSLPPMPPQISYAQIVKMPPATEERKYEVRQRLLEFRERILKGEKMTVLASLYSQDPGTKVNGGEYRSKFAESVAPFADAVRQLKPGQISEIVETEFGFHLIELISKTDDSFVCRHLLLKPEFTVAEEQAATKELDSIAQLIRDKKLTFEDAALRYSDDVETKMNGGLNFNVMAFRQTFDLREASTRFILDELNNPMDSRMLGKMQVGDISDAYQNMDMKGNYIFKIVKLVESIPTHKVNLEDDFVFIESQALIAKQEKAINEWIDKAIKKMFIIINPEYMAYQLERDTWKVQSEKCAKKQ